MGIWIAHFAQVGLIGIAARGEEGFLRSETR